MSAGVGGMATRGAMWAGGRVLAGRGATAAVTNAATRQFATSMTGRVIGGIAGGAANFGTFEGIKEMETQFAHGGHIVGQDDTGRYLNEGYSASAVAGQAAHGFLMGGAIGWLTPVSGNVADKLVRSTSSTGLKVMERAGVYSGATMLEGTIFSVPEWIEGNRDAMDVWTDNMAMMVGFKAKHMIKSAGNVLGDLKASFDSPTNGRKNRLDFESRLRQRMDAPSDGGLSLTKDEAAELSKHGYGDLRELVESAERTGDATKGELITANAPEIVSRLTDMVTDPRISEAARAKMYYYATGRKLPESTVMKGELIEDGEGGFIVESQGANGVITSRSFKSRKAADLELERIKRQTELNHIEIGERYQQTADFENRLQEACRTVAAENGWDMVEVYRTCEEARRNNLRGGDKQFDEAQQNILRKVTEAMGEFEETSVTDNMRGRINDKYGVDIDNAIRKEANRRTIAEQTAIDEYLDELIPKNAKERNTVEDAEAEDITNQKLLTDEPEATTPTNDAPIDPRFDNPTTPEYDPHQPGGEQKPVGRAVMKYQDRPVEVLSGRVVMMEDGTMIDNERSDASIVVRDLETGKVEMVSPDAILSYEGYPAEVEVPQDNVAPEAETPAEPQPKYTTGQIKIRNSDGTETRGVLTGFVDENGNHEYYVEGDLQQLHYASEHELDNILSEYTPDEPQEVKQPQPAEPQPVDPNRPTQEGVANVEDYDKGYSFGIDETQGISDSELTAKISELRTDAERLTDFGRGMLEAYEYEQQRRAMEQQLVPVDAETVPKTEETTLNPMETGVNITETVPKTEIPIENVQQSVDDGNVVVPAPATNEAPQVDNVSQPDLTAQAEPTPLQRIPRNEKNEPIFEQAESPEVGWDALVEFSEGDAATAKEIADTMVEEKRKAFEKAQKLKPKGKTPTEILASKKANTAELTKAQAEYEQWQRMAGVENARQSAIRSQQEVEARRLAAERAEAEKAEREAREEAARLEREALEGIPEWHMDTPENARKRGVRRFSGQMFTRQEPVQGVVGNEVEVKFSQKDLPKGRVAVIEASQLQPSHVQGQRNPMFFIEEAQPKNRTEAVSMFAAKEMAEGIRPKEITGSVTAYTGAPTVNTRGEVIQGNNRSDALRYLWQSNLPQQQQTYKQYLIDNAEQFGIDPEAVNAMQNPVLVNMLDVDDAEAIRLGQMTAQDTESGGIERIKPKNVAQTLGDNMRTFANMLLSSDKLPAKAQRAILATAFRDMDSPFAGKMLPEIQASIIVYNQLMSDPTFANAKKMEEVLKAVEAFKQTIALDDRFEHYMPADNFSNFALHLAAMYKATDMSQATIASYFNQMYDLAQGKKAATLFDEADTTEYPLAEVINQVLNFEYQPAKNGNNDVANGGADVALRNQVSQGGELRGNEPPASGEQTPTGTEPSDSGAGASDDSSTAGVEAVEGETPQSTDAAAITGEGYKVEPKPYTNKQGKTLDTYLVTFDRDFSKEELSTLRAKAKALKGWYDRETRGWMLRGADDAKAFAKDIVGKSEDEVADEAPLSLADMEKPASDKPKKAPVNRVNVEGVMADLYTKGETKLSDHAEPVEPTQTKPKKRRWISDEDADEFNNLRDNLRNHFGKGDDIVQERMDAEVLRMGTRMTYLMMKGGLRSFADYCEAMIDELPDIFDDMRPHLKSLYAAAQNMEEVIELGWDEEMDDRKTVKAFDVYNFDKPGAKDIIATSQHIVDEQSSQQHTDQIIQTLKDQRNEQRKKEADETSADTEAIADKAEAVASKVESELEVATTEQDAERLSRDLDKEIEDVNKQLALLGYYEAVEDDSKFHESYGYMLTAEKKAVSDATNLAKQIVKDLGIDIKVTSATTPLGRKNVKKGTTVRANLAPAGGEIYITLPLNEGRHLKMYIGLEPVAEQDSRRRGDNLKTDRIMYRVEWPDEKGYVSFERIGRNCWAASNVTYDELLTAIRREARNYLPEDVVKPATPLTPQPGEDMVQMAERVAKLKAPKKSRIPDEQPMNDLFGGLFDEAEPKQDSAQFVKDMADMLERGESPFTVTPEVEAELAKQREAENNSTTPKNNSHEKTDVQARPETAGRGGQQPRPNEPLGTSAEHEAERTDGGRMAQRGGVHTVSDTKRGTGVSDQHKSERGVAQPKNIRNNHAERGVDYAPKGEKARIDANLAAIEVAKKLLASGETATPKEMEVLRRYSGWGGLGSAFNEGSTWSPNPINKRLREILTPEEYEAAVMSRNSAYYTPAPVIDAMWDIAKALGFKGGNIVEGSAGIGNIIGLMPTEISERSNIHAVEIDNTTGGILSLLYPDAKVEVQGFEKTRIANGSVDLAITNVPFVTGLHVMDESGDSDLSKKFRDIHDFCIAKNVRKLREGGIGIFITSSGTLDKSQKLRNWLVGDKEGCADVVGVFRMNNQTFGGTAATSDIIVVRKRVNGRKSANAIDISTVTPVRTASFEDDRGKTKDLPMLINRYFIEHPEYMGGEMFFGFEQGDTYRPTSMGLFPTRTADQPARMAAWVQHIAEMDWSKEQGTAVAEQTTHINEALGKDVKEGSMVTDSNGNLCVARMGSAVPLTFNKNKIKGRTKEQCFADYTDLKNALADVLKYQTEHNDDAGLQPLLDRLNSAYDTFVARYGNLNKNNNLAWLRNDVDFSSIVALETYSEKGSKDGTKIKTYGKTDIFSRRVVEKESEPAPKNVKDGIIASLYKYGRIDPEYLASQLGKSQADVKQEIIESGLGFENPTTGQMEVSYEYLSGNVREKLRQAREANEAANGAYDANIKALEAVVPMNIPAHLIEFTLGSSWVDPKLYERFVKERTDLNVRLTNAGGTWHMSEPYWTDEPKNKEMGIRSESLGILIPGHKLIEAAITNKTITVSKTTKNSDGTTTTETDAAATTACATKVDEIRQDFKDWAREQMQNDPELSMRMEEVYNEKFNNSVPKSIPDEFVPEHFGGAATMVGGRPFRLRPHQAKAVIRATTQPVLLAHEVGTGKTYTLITTAMEMRRLGTARKPMIVVQNATVGQFVASAKALYPNAKVLTLEDADRNAEGRKAFYAKIKFNDWDMIVVPQSVFERIPDSVERQTQFIQDKIEEKLLVLDQMKDADPDGRSMIVRAAEREIEKLKDEISQLANGGATDKKKEKDAKKAAVTRQNAEVKAREMLDRATDDVEDFDSMGIDAILVDEAHEYKHLGFATAMQRGVKGVDPSFSKKSQGVFLKTQSVLEKTGGKNVVFATGTPISNTAAEIWTFMRYLMSADVMKDYGIYYFDDFVRNFGNLQQMLEFSTSGKYKENNRFAGYVNLPELVRIWSTVADTVLTREAGGVSDKIPQMEGGKAQDIFLPQTRALRSIMKFVKEQLDAYDNMSGKEKKENSHIPLVMYGIAKAAAVDARLVQSDAEDDPNSKTNEAVRQTLRTLEEAKDYNGTVAIFADNYQNKVSGFNLYEDIRKKLISAGVPEEQIVVMKSGMTVNKKLEIFSRVNAGEVRVIMGSTFTLGTGVNIQERLHTLIHLDAPNRPMDYTQRNGRILRQGNLHNEWGIPVRVLRFGVEDSLDVTAYQRLKTKGAIADSIMNGKQLMENSMENRALEEDQDLFGDITAQLSGSEYAMLKNQIEKEVRKLTAQRKSWEADQTYIHNRKRQIAGQNKEAEKRIAENKSYLEKVEAATVGDITVDKLSYPSVEAMEDFFTEQNKRKAELQEQVRKSGYSSRPATSDITISVGGFNFHVHTEINRETKQGQQGDLFYSAPAKMTYSCPELGIEAMPVKGNVIKNAVTEILNDVVSGEDFRGRIEAAERSIERNNAELQSISARDGVPFKFTEELAKAEEKLSEYEDLMKAEMEAKEAKYAELDKEVEAASNIELTEEDSEDAASEPIASYSEENANFASRYETQDGKTINYTSENAEGYGGLFDFDFSGENAGGNEVGMRSGANDLQRQGDTGLNRHNSRLDKEAGEFSLIERVFRESGSFNFTSGEKIESADDVAFIFSALEDAAKEHSFVVLVKDGKPTVVELGMGTFTATMVDIPTASLAYNRIQPDQVYFVHNHPSGNLMCSPQDVQMLRKIADISKVPVHGVIINLKTGKYGTFDTDNTSGVGQKRVPENESPLAVHTLDKQIFAPNYDPMEQPLVRGSEDVAKFLNSQRMGDRAKMSFIILSRAGRIVGNIHTPFTKLPTKSDEIARYISERVIQFGGESAILYGDFTHEGSKMVAYRNLKDNLNKVGGTTLLDVVNVEGNNTRSANDDGLLYELGSEYGASTEAKSSHAERMSKKFNTPIRIVTDTKELTNDNSERQARMRRSKGFYDPATGEVVIVLPNNANVEDVAETVFHEVVAHKGLREMIGEENYDAFCDEIYNHLKDDLKQQVEEDATRRFVNEPGKEYEHHRRVAVDEMFGRMSEKGFEDFTKAERGIWVKLKAKVLEAINKFLGSLKLPKWVKLGDNELRYMLWRSHEKLRTKGDYVDMARDAAKRDELGLSSDARFRDGETSDIWKDQSIGLEERITNAAIRLSNNQSADLTLRNDAMRAVTNNLQSLLHSMRNRRGTAQSFVGADRKVEAGVVDAMNAQAMFDRSTVKRVSDLARILMQNGYLSGMTSGEMQRLLSAVKNATAMHDIADSVQKIMDIMVDNQLRNGEASLRQLLAIRGSKVDARGVEVQGALDVDGQHTMEVVKKAISLTEDDITDRIAEAMNRMSDPDQTIADQAAIEYAGLNMALDYVQNIANSKAEEKALRDSLKIAKEDRDAGRMTDDAYKQFIETTEDAIRKNKIERTEAYFNLVGRLSDSLRGSIENAKAFREAEKARISEIHHNANSDMEGRPTNEHHKDDWQDKFVNNGFVQFLFAPLGTFDQIMRVFGNKSANGEGYLWNRFMRGWVDCRNKELRGIKDKFAQLDEKAAELFGKSKTWGDIIRMERKLPKASVSFWDGGEMRDHELTQGNLLYIYMVDKMTDGRMKLRRMGITEQNVADIENFLDPRFKALGDWLQDDFLVATRNEYNETHKRMFGASMAAIENYFPLKILANARVDKEEDVNQQNRPDGITTKTGSIIKRRVNNLALDITGADALSVILDHITQMEHWSAYAEWNRDLNTLRTYKRFRNQVINMTTVYGGGRRLWENFNDLCLMAAGEYRPPVSRLNKNAVNLAKGVTAAKVSFRLFTALKQFLSAPAYAPEVNLKSIAKSIANPYGDFKWCLENLPIFRERWHSRISGDPRLLKSDMDWKMWRSRVMEISSRIGMTPNAFVDAVTVSIGARAMYETRLNQYLKEGYPADAAEKRAMQDATILFNQTQQSSESPFLSTMQVDKDWLSTLFTVFRNSSMSYTRQTYDGARNLKRNLTSAQRAKSVAFMTKQILRDWEIDPESATDDEYSRANDAARKRFRRQIKKDVIRLATFGYVLEWLWNLGPYLPYIIFGYYISEKDKMWDDVITHSYFGSIEGLTGGDVMSSFGNMWASGEWSRNQLSKDMPLASDINTIANKFIGGKNAEAVNDILNLLVQSGIGMNPQSLTDAAIAITDACGDDPALSHEAAIFVMRVLQVPQSQLDKLYFDEIGLNGEEASKLTPQQLAARYAEYKVKRGTPLAPWFWGDEERLGKYEELAKDRMTERLESRGDAAVKEAYADFEARYKAVNEKAEKARAMIKTDYAAAAQAHAALQQDPDFTLYQRFGSLDKQLGRISKMWLTSKTPEEAALIASTIPAYRAGMVKVLQAETVENQQSAMSELTTLMNEFYSKYQAMQPQSQQLNR